MRVLSATGAICLAMAAAYSAPAKAETSALTSDVRCLIVAMQLQSSTDDKVKSTATLLSYYYYGRVDGRAPKLDLETAMLAEAGKMTPETMQADAKRCGNELQARATAISTVAQDLSRRIGGKLPGVAQ